MFDWLKNRLSKKKPDPYFDDESWITVPFRFAEAARVSIYTIGSQPEVPEAIRWWIAQWLASYNNQLVYYMREQYGPDVFPLLDRITRDVMPEDDNGQRVSVVPEEESWDRWEKQFGEDSNE